MANVINRASFADFNNNLTIRWTKSYAGFPKHAAVLYNVESTDVDTGDISGMDGFSTARVKREGGDFAFLNLTQNYRKAWTTYEVGGMTKITWNMRRYSKYDLINRAISNLAESAAKRVEIDMTHRFTFANSTAYTNIDGDSVSVTVGDGLALLSTVHTVPGSATTFRNRVANNPILSKGGLEAAEKLFATQMIDTNGELTFQEPTHLVITNDPNSVNTAQEYLKSYADPTASQAGVTNVYEGKYGLIILPYLSTSVSGSNVVYDSTKAKYWFLVNMNHKDAYMKVGQEPTFITPADNGGKDFETMDWKYACQASFALSIVDPRWIIASLGDGTA
jgi:hypothetical protein